MLWYFNLFFFLIRFFVKFDNKLSLSRVILLDSIDSSISSVHGRKITEEKPPKQIYRYTDTRPPNSINNEMICILCMKRHTSVFFYRIFFKRLSVLKWSSPCTKSCISFRTYSCSIWSDNSYGEFRVMTKEWILISRCHNSCGELANLQYKSTIYVHTLKLTE